MMWIGETSWPYFFLVWRWVLTINTDLSTTSSVPKSTVSALVELSTPSVHDLALEKIDKLIILVEKITNSSDKNDKNNSNRPSSMVSEFVDTLSELCQLLHPYHNQWPPMQLVYAPAVIAYQPTDQFGCNALLSNLRDNLTTVPENSTLIVSLCEKTLLQWKKKLDGDFAHDPANAKIAINLSSKFPSLSPRRHHSTTLVPPFTTTRATQRWGGHGQTTTSTATAKPGNRWINKGLSRYDTAWVRPDFDTGREIVFYDNSDPSKKEHGSSRLSVLHSALRILPAFIVIAFLIVCWYCFVYRRMRHRHRRTRALLSQYQALLNDSRLPNGGGVRTPGGGFMVVSQSEGSGPRLVVCSSSTYDSCLNELCDTDSSCPPTERPAVDGTSATSVDGGANRPRNRPQNYPPTYDEIFPPPYESLYGSII